MASVRYNELLKSIQNTVIKLADTVNLELPIINIDWSAREIILPKALQSFIAVQNDHEADTIYFCADRYFDGVDLANMTCIVEYVNAKGEGRISPVLDVDITTDPSKIYFGWKLTRGATKEAGKLTFAVRLYAIDLNTDEFVYNLGTQPCVGTILRGLGKSTYPDQAGDDLKVDEAQALLDRITQLENKAVRWVDV